MSFDFSWQYLICFSAACSQNLRRQCGHWMLENIWDRVFRSLSAIYFLATFFALDSIYSWISASVGFIILKFRLGPWAPRRHAMTCVPLPISDTARALGEFDGVWTSSLLLYVFGTIGRS